MKLIYCPMCKDVRRLTRRKRKCSCGQAWGRYVNDLEAEVGGTAVPLGIAWSSFNYALRHRPKEGMGGEFVAFVIPKKCDTVQEVEG